jgi:hypothetical protein
MIKDKVDSDGFEPHIRGDLERRSSTQFALLATDGR